MNRAWCTYFDSRYLAQGIVMLRSLQRHDSGAVIHVLAFDDLCALILRERFADSVRLLRLEQLHAHTPSLAALSDRTRWAVYATHKPAFTSFVMDTGPHSVTFIDADTWFFSSPEPIYGEIGEASLALSPHRFTTSRKDLEAYGLYNAGCIYWRNDGTGRRCLSDWAADCVAWCDERLQRDGRFMNQGYLNRWPEQYSNVHVIEHPGVNLAPWNLEAHRLARAEAGVTVDGAPLIFYHFSGLVREPTGLWRSIFPLRDAPRRWDLFRTGEKLAQELLYRPYLRVVEEESRRLTADYGFEGVGSVRNLKITAPTTPIPIE